MTVHKEVKPENINKAKSQPTGLKKMLGGLARHFKKSARKKESDQYMGEKLKTSTWTHIHTALMQARNGQATTAKLHADIANQALKEAAHYMSEQDYKAFFAEVETELNKLEEIKK